MKAFLKLILEWFYNYTGTFHSMLIELSAVIKVMSALTPKVYVCTVDIIHLQVNETAVVNVVLYKM